VSDRVAVMYLGKIVEIARGADLYRSARHPYTGALLSAIPSPDPIIARDHKRIPLRGDVPSPVNPPAGCRFHPRCPVAAANPDERMATCSTVVPELTDMGTEHIAACHYPLAPTEAAAISGVTTDTPLTKATKTRKASRPKARD
jgi:oligopeptide/dipeptide ABC transporter ATP-binding protein